MDAHEVDASERVSLSVALKGALTWLKQACELLAVLEEPGRVRLLPWQEAGPVLERLGELTELATRGDSSAVEDLLLLQDRYRRVAYGADTRVSLPKAILSHLGARAGDTLFIAGFPHHVELWNTSQRETRLARISERLADLP